MSTAPGKNILPKGKTPRVKTAPVGWPTYKGDLGVLNLGMGDEIPKQTRHPSRTGDAKTNHVGDALGYKDSKKMKKVLKNQGMLI